MSKPWDDPESDPLRDVLETIEQCTPPTLDENGVPISDEDLARLQVPVIIKQFEIDVEQLKKSRERFGPEFDRTAMEASAAFYAQEDQQLGALGYIVFENFDLGSVDETGFGKYMISYERSKKMRRWSIGIAILSAALYVFGMALGIAPAQPLAVVGLAVSICLAQVNLSR